jgi:hypothetical protein
VGDGGSAQHVNNLSYGWIIAGWAKITYRKNVETGKLGIENCMMYKTTRYGTRVHENKNYRRQRRMEEKG